MTVYFNSRDQACKQPFGAVEAGQKTTFTLRLSKTLGQALAPLLRIYRIDQWNESRDIPMVFTKADMVFNHYTCTFTPREPELLMYLFVLAGEGYREIKRDHDGSAQMDQGELWQLTVYDPAMKTPACLTEGVMYQIFPDRFANSGAPREGVPEDRTLRQDWGELPQWRPNEWGEVTNSDYFGGDLRGITQKLDYLASLGVTALYLNPIFEAHSNHRYNTADYHKVDPLLGTQEDFRELCRQAKARGMGVILDGVFSHTGSDSVYFNRQKRYGEGGAYNDRNSPYFPWYRFYEYPDVYESWWGFGTLPNVEESEPSYLDFICGREGVLRSWMRMGAAGFRLDVADELPDVFLDRLHQAIKEEDPDGVIIGEVWEDASNKVSYGVRRRYLLGRQLDSVMNYPFKDALLRFIRHGDGHGLLNTVMQILENYPQPVIPALMNSLSTHDTPRAITMLAGEPMGDNERDWQEAHHHLSPEQYSHGKLLLRLAFILQYGLPGMPCVYYGDEAGLYGYRDPFNRTCYPWGREDRELLETARSLGDIRRRYPVFSRAAFLPLVFDGALCVFCRVWQGETFLFAVNRGDGERTLALPPGVEPELLHACGRYGDGRLQGYSGVVLRWQGTP